MFKIFLFFIVFLKFSLFALSPSLGVCDSSKIYSYTGNNLNPSLSSQQFWFDESSRSSVNNNSFVCSNGLTGIIKDPFTKCTAPDYTNRFRCLTLMIYDISSTQCPAGQIVENNKCVIRGSGDSDSDGISDKCDYDSSDFANYDCDSDSILNKYDSDLDGDGVSNLKDKKPNDKDNSTSCPTLSKNDNVRYDLSASTCSISNAVFKADNGAIFNYSTVRWDGCRQACVYDIDQCPFGMAVYNGKCKKPSPVTTCNRGITTSIDKLFVIDESTGDSVGGCTKRFYCGDDSLPYFKQAVSCSELDPDWSSFSENKPEERTAEEVGVGDSNSSGSSSSDLRSALNSSDLTKDSTSLQQLSEQKTQTKKLDNINESIKNATDFLGDMTNGIIGSVDNVKSSVDGLSSGIGSVKGSVDSVKSSVDSVKGSIDEGNGLLSDILGALVGDGGDVGSVDGELSQFKSFLDVIFGQFSTFSINVQNNLSDIQNQFDNAKTVFSGTRSFTAPAGSVSNCATFTALGRSYSLDLQFLGVMAPILYFIFSVFFMVLNFRFLLSNFLKGSE